MTNFKRILFPVEFSPECQRAASHVGAWARRFHAEVILIHVELTPTMVMEGMVWEPQTEQTIEKLRGFLTEEFSDLVVHRVVRRGDPATEIVRYVRNEGADLIMMPTHGRGPFRRFLLGSVAAKILHDAPCPVWTAAHVDNNEWASEPTLDNVFCAVDLDERGIHTLRYAGIFTQTTGARLTVGHAVAFAATVPTGYMGCDLRADLMDDARKRLTEMQKEAGAPGVQCVGTGNVSGFIAHAAKQHQADLVIIGRGGHGLLERLRTHDYAIIRECACPVLSL